MLHEQYLYYFQSNKHNESATIKLKPRPLYSETADTMKGTFVKAENEAETGWREVPNAGEKESERAKLVTLPSTLPASNAQ